MFFVWLGTVRGAAGTGDQGRLKLLTMTPAACWRCFIAQSQFRPVELLVCPLWSISSQGHKRSHFFRGVIQGQLKYLGRVGSPSPLSGIQNRGLLPLGKRTNQPDFTVVGKVFLFHFFFLVLFKKAFATIPRSRKKQPT